MELWFVITVTVCIAFLLKALFNIYVADHKIEKHQLPPGPSNIPIISALLWLRKSPSQFESALRRFRSKYGTIVSLTFISRPSIFILNRSVAQQALVQSGALFASRPKQLLLSRTIINNGYNINSSPYGSTWRLLRRNLNSQILHPSRVKSYSHARKWVLDILVNRLQANGGESGVKVMDHLRYAMFCLLVLMCFGDKLDETKIHEIEAATEGVLFNLRRFQVLNFWPRVTKILFRRRWNELYDILKRRQDVLISLIRDRKEATQFKAADTGDGSDSVVAYIDTLMGLELEDEAAKSLDTNKGLPRKLSEEEMVPLCSEFLTAGTDTTSTALQWIMANLVKYPQTQETLLEEMKGVVGEAAKEVRQEDLARMPYLKAIILEGLRRHPPGHFLLPHAVTKEVEFNGYHIPKDASVNVFVADIGWDPEVWEDPMMFKPERFLKKTSDTGMTELDPDFDITGSRGEIKMMPFGVGRRICPGLNLALLHLEYFVANLVWKFQWEAVDEVDLSEKPQFTVVMKNPLHARLSPRF